MSRDEKLKANQKRLAAKRRAKRMAQAMTKKSTTEKPKTEKPKSSNNTKVAFDKKTNFGDYGLKSKPKTTPQRTTPTPTPTVTQQKKKDPPKQSTPPAPQGGTPNQVTPKMSPVKKPKIGEKKVHRGITYRYDGQKWINIGKQQENKPNSGSASRNARRGTANK